MTPGCVAVWGWRHPLAPRHLPLPFVSWCRVEGPMADSRGMALGGQCPGADQPPCAGDLPVARPEGDRRR